MVYMCVCIYVFVEPMIIPGFQRAARRALHCYYNETRINTSRWYVIGAITFLWWFSWPRRARIKERKREKKKERERERNEAGRASSLGPEKLSEIMSEEIGSLARGWLTARSARTTFFLSLSISPLPPGITRVLSRYILEHLNRRLLPPFPQPRSLSPDFLPLFPPFPRSAHRERQQLRVFFFPFIPPDYSSRRRNNPMIEKYYRTRRSRRRMSKETKGPLLKLSSIAHDGGDWLLLLVWSRADYIPGRMARE